MRVTRRDLLGAGTALALGSLSGCSGLRRSITGHRLAHEVTVLNDLHADLDLSLTVTDASGASILRKRFQLSNGMGDTSHPFEGTPARIRLRAAGIDSRTVDWPTPRNGACQGSMRTTATIWFKPLKTYVQGNCETITTE